MLSAQRSCKNTTHPQNSANKRWLPPHKARGIATIAGLIAQEVEKKQKPDTENHLQNN